MIFVFVFIRWMPATFLIGKISRSDQANETKDLPQKQQGQRKAWRIPSPVTLTFDL
jgi:hypothetical protein